MKKELILLLMALGVLTISGCTNNEESLPSNDMYTSISERNMPSYCRQQVSKEYGIYAGDIYLYPLKYEKGAKIIRGRYSIDSTHLEEFACIFNNNNTFAGINMVHRNVKNTLYYRD